MEVEERTHPDVNPVQVKPSLREVLELFPEELVLLKLIVVVCSADHCDSDVYASR